MSIRGKAKGLRMIKEIIRLQKLGLSKRKIAKALGCSRNTVAKYLEQQGDLLEKSRALYQAPWSGQISWDDINQKVNRGIPLSECWEEVGSQSENCHSIPYVSFWREYRRRFPNAPLDMHKYHPPGERCEIDYKGDTAGLGYIDRTTGEFVPCRLFGAVLCFSQLFFPRATHTEQQCDILMAASAAFEFFGGVPFTTVVDNAKTCVRRAHRYDPDINKEFAHFCEHYGTAPIATRPRRPKDKNVIENALGVFWRWARRKIRSHRSYSLADLNRYLLELVEEFNGRIQRKYGISRHAKFLQGEKEKLLTLPNSIYQFAEWKTAKVHPDCHVQISYNFYSVPYQLRGKKLEVRISYSLVEIFHQLERVACHLKPAERTRGRYLTKKQHLPEAHSALQEQFPQALLEEAQDVGPSTFAIISHLIHNATHPLMYTRRAQGILRLQKRYSRPALERACQTIQGLGTLTARLSDIEEIIKTNLNPKSATALPIRRQSNSFLRGQLHWSLNPTNKEK